MYIQAMTLCFVLFAEFPPSQSPCFAIILYACISNELEWEYTTSPPTAELVTFGVSNHLLKAPCFTN